MLKSVILSLCATSALAAVSPVESGNWVEATYSHSVQQCAGGIVSGETFDLPTTDPNGSTSGAGCSNGHLRAEWAFSDDYSSGTRQFGGQFVVNSMGGNDISLKQTFHGDIGAYFILAVATGGRLYSVDGGATISANAAQVGHTVTVNTVHDADNHEFRVYINGALSYTDNNAPTGDFFYDKIGAYTTTSGSGPIDVTWSNVIFWNLS